MRKFMYLGLLTASISSVVIAAYLYSMYSFIPEGSPDPLVSLDSPMRKELSSVKLIGIYSSLSLVASLLLWVFNKYAGKWGVFALNALISVASILGFYFVLTYLRDGWDVFQIIGTPLFYIWPLIWMGCQPLFLMEIKSK
jgi:hypothetical protein